MKKILISLAIIGVVAAIGVGATVAYFSDTETSTGNTFTAGTLDLTINNPGQAIFNVGNLKPNDSGHGTWTLTNAGSVDGYVDIHNITLANYENGCNDPETKVSDPTCGTSTDQGELSANMDVRLCVDVDNNGVCNEEDTSIYTGKLSGIASDYDANIALAAGATKYITMTWSIDSGVGNIIQSDSTTMGLTFELGQTTGQ